MNIGRQHLTRAVVKGAIIKSIENEWIRDKWGCTPFNFLGMQPTTGAFLIWCIQVLVSAIQDWQFVEWKWFICRIGNLFNQNSSRVEFCNIWSSIVGLCLAWFQVNFSTVMVPPSPKNPSTALLYRHSFTVNYW